MDSIVTAVVGGFFCLAMVLAIAGGAMAAGQDSRNRAHRAERERRRRAREIRQWHREDTGGYTPPKVFYTNYPPADRFTRLDDRHRR